MNEARDAEEKHVREVARAVIERHLGSKPRSIERLGGGITNFVFEAEHAAGELVVRLSPDIAKVQQFTKEQWAIAHARRAGVPTPEVLEVGCEDSLAFMISRKTPGREATHHERRLEVLEEIGRLAALVHTVPTSGFGGTFDWSQNQLSRNDTWEQFLERELTLDARLETFVAHGLLDEKRCRRLRERLHELGTLGLRPALNHGDLRLKNTLTDDEGRITALIDWELASSNLAPYWDLSLALHDLSIDAMERLLSGYGLSPRRVREMAPYLKALNVVNYAPFIGQALEAHDEAQLERFRTRLAGALDLYSL